MQWRSILEMLILGGGVFALVWLTFRMGRAVLNRLGINPFLKPEPMFIMVVQGETENPVFQPVPDGQERLATQLERDDINEKIGRDQSPSGVGNTPL